MIYWRLAVYVSLTAHRLIESYIDLRQYSALNNRKLPSSLEGLFNQSTVDKSSQYEKDRLKLKVCRNFWEFLISVLFIQRNAYRDFWDLSESILQWFFNGSTYSSIKRALVCSNSIRLLDLIVLLPFDLASSFIVEEKHGFNKLTWRKFCSDKLKLYAMGCILNSLFLAGLIRVVEFGGDSFVLYASVFLVVFYCLVFTLIPMIIFPWFYKLTPLKEGELKSSITKLAIKQRFPSTDIYLCDGSSRSSHSNAFFTGLPWAKRIIIYDTFVESATIDEVVGVLAHELGHWKNHDILKLTALGICDILAGLHLFSLVYKSSTFYEAFGFAGLSPIYIGYVLFQELSKVTNLISKLVRNVSTRAIEYEADMFAANIGYRNSLSNALVKLESKNLAATNTDWLYAIYSLNHPSLSERLDAIDVFDRDL